MIDNKKKKSNALKGRTRVFCAVTAAALALLCAAPVNDSHAAKSYLDGITSASIREKQQEVEDAKNQKAQIEGMKSDVEKIKQELEQQKNDLSAYITELDAALAQMQYNIEDLSDQIYLKQTDIAETEEQLAQAKDDEKQRYEDMIVRMRKMYEKNESGILSSLFGATSLRDLLNRMDYIEAVVSYDRNSWETLKLARAYVELCEEELEAEKEALDEALAAVEQEEANMEVLINEKNAQLTEYQINIANQQSEINKYENQIDEFDDEIDLLNAAIRAEQEAIYAASQSHASTYDGGSFIFPIASYRYISSKYGYRTDPIYGTTKFHSGVDLAAPAGTAIYAAYNGVVAETGYTSSMGNYVMIDHGDKLFTIYMHASVVYVSKGEAVTTGQTIAGVGSTGKSTGNHLHFTVRKNGEYVDPNDYVYFYAR